MVNLVNEKCFVDKADVWVAIGPLVNMHMMQLVGLIFSGLVKKSSVSSMLGLSLVTLSITTIEWFVIGYSFVFGNSFSGIIDDTKYLESLLNFNNKCTNEAGYAECV